MDLIQNWSSEDKTKLLNSILKVLGDKEYIDICVYGSRVTGDFTVKSDIDVGIYVDNIERCKCCKLQPKEILSYVNGIHRPENELGDWFIMDITFHDKETINNWPEFDDTYELPKYSLITNKYFKGSKEDTARFKSIKLK